MRSDGVEVLGEYCVELRAARVSRRDLQRAPHRLVARLQVAELLVQHTVYTSTYSCCTVQYSFILNMKLS